MFHNLSMNNLTHKIINEPVKGFILDFLNRGDEVTLVLIVFLVVLVIQFVLVLILYKANKASVVKIKSLEGLFKATADKALSIKKRADVVTYQDIVARLKKGEKAFQIAQEVNINLNELEALERVLKAIK